MPPEDSPPYVTSARPLTPQEEAFRHWLETDGAPRLLRLVEGPADMLIRCRADGSVDSALTQTAMREWVCEVLAAFSEAAFGAGWTARDHGRDHTIPPVGAAPEAR